MHSETRGTCSKYQSKAAVDAANKDRGKDRALVKEFLQYYEPCKSHEDSLRLEKNLGDVCDTMARKLMDAGQSRASTMYGV